MGFNGSGAWGDSERDDAPARGGECEAELLVERDGEIGTVVDVQEDGGGTLLEVEKDGTRSVLPFVEAFLAGVDREARRIDLRLPEGLLATCAFKS